MMPRSVIESVPASRPGELAFHAFVPECASTAGVTSLVVAVHGISLNAREQVESFAPFAEARGQVVIAPCFDTPEDNDYQRLGRRGRGRRADLALDEAIRRLSEQAAIRFSRRFFFGYSGGGQFVHRYLMTHPDRVDAAVVAAAGWYTFPDARLAYPMGLRVGGALAGVRIEPADFLPVPVLAIVGSLDVERDESVRTNSKIDERQGADRRERARRWIDAMRAAARARSIPGRHDLIELDGAGHSFLECVEVGLATSIFDFFDSIEKPPYASMDSNFQKERNPA
jgi:poly(3-hydroxybutyrate) depolymerase